MGSTYSYSSVHNSRSSETFKAMNEGGHDDVFVPPSNNNNPSKTTESHRMNLHYLPQVTQALPDERLEYRQLLATEIRDAKEQHVTDFLR